MDNDNRFDESSVVHYWEHTNKSAAIALNHKMIQSTHWYLDQMHPGSTNFYFFQDTWKDMYKIQILDGVPTDKHHLILGGGPCQWAEYIHE